MYRIAKWFIVIVLLISLALGLYSCVSSTNTVKIESAGIDALYELENNNEFLIKERFFSLGKCYDVYTVKNNKEFKIGEIRGKFIKAFGDVFTFYDLDDNIVAYEEEVYKPIKLTRSAKIYTADNSLLGYIGEEIESNLFDPGYYFHYYNASGEEIGYSDQHIFSLLKSNSVHSINGVKEYSISEEFNVINDEYRITSIENPSIPKIYVLFSACIEDAIRDSEQTKNDD